MPLYGPQPPGSGGGGAVFNDTNPAPESAIVDTIYVQTSDRTFHYIGYQTVAEVPATVGSRDYVIGDANVYYNHYLGAFNDSSIPSTSAYAADQQLLYYNYESGDWFSASGSGAWVNLATNLPNNIGGQWLGNITGGHAGVITYLRNNGYDASTPSIYYDVSSIGVMVINAYTAHVPEHEEPYFVAAVSMGGTGTGVDETRVNQLIAAAGHLDAANNLSDLGDVASALSTLGGVDATRVNSLITTAIDALIDGAPGNLNTLREVADYINLLNTRTNRSYHQAIFNNPNLVFTDNSGAAESYDLSELIAGLFNGASINGGVITITRAGGQSNIMLALPSGGAGVADGVVASATIDDTTYIVTLTTTTGATIALNLSAIRTGLLQAANNLTDVVNRVQALANLGGAPLLNPTFTGLPRAPTQPEGNSETTLANTAFVTRAIATLIAGAPANLSNLNNIAAAMNDDANFAATVEALIVARAPLLSPNFSGNPRVPTAASDDNDTTIANTEFVTRALAALVLGTLIVQPDENGNLRTPTSADRGKLALEHGNIRIGSRVVEPDHRPIVAWGDYSAARFRGVHVSFGALFTIMNVLHNDTAYVDGYGGRGWYRFDLDGGTNWRHWGGPNGWIGFWDTVDEADDHVNTVGDVAGYNGSIHEVLAPFVPVGEDYVFYEWQQPSEITELFARSLLAIQGTPNSYEAGKWWRTNMAGNAVEQVDLDTTIQDATGGLPEPSAALEGFEAIDRYTGVANICVNRPHVTSKSVGTFAPIAARDDFTIVQSRGVATAADQGHFIFELDTEKFYFADTGVGDTHFWYNDEAADVLRASQVTATNTPHFIGVRESDEYALEHIHALAANTEYFYYNFREHAIERLDNTTFTPAGGVASHYLWIPVTSTDARRASLVRGASAFTQTYVSWAAATRHYPGFTYDDLSARTGGALGTLLGPLTLPGTWGRPDNYVSGSAFQNIVWLLMASLYEVVVANENDGRVVRVKTETVPGSGGVEAYGLGDVNGYATSAADATVRSDRRRITDILVWRPAGIDHWVYDEAANHEFTGLPYRLNNFLSQALKPDDTIIDRLRDGVLYASDFITGRFAQLLEVSRWVPYAESTTVLRVVNSSIDDLQSTGIIMPELGGYVKWFSVNFGLLQDNERDPLWHEILLEDLLSRTPAVAGTNYNNLNSYTIPNIGADGGSEINLGITAARELLVSASNVNTTPGNPLRVRVST